MNQSQITHIPVSAGDTMLLASNDDRHLFLVRINNVLSDTMTVTPIHEDDAERLGNLSGTVYCELIRLDALYRFTAERKNNTADGTIQLKMPPEINRVQRREHVRLNHVSSVVYKKLANSDEPQEWIFSDTVNISASGMLIACDERIRETDYILINSELLRSLGITKPVLATAKRLTRQKNQPVCGVRFLTRDSLNKQPVTSLDPNSYLCMDELLANRIGHFIFNKQIEMRNNGQLV